MADQPQRQRDRCLVEIEYKLKAPEGAQGFRRAAGIRERVRNQEGNSLQESEAKSAPFPSRFQRAVDGVRVRALEAGHERNVDVARTLFQEWRAQYAAAAAKDAAGGCQDQETRAGSGATTSRSSSPTAAARRASGPSRRPPWRRARATPPCTPGTPRRSCAWATPTARATCLAATAKPSPWRRTRRSGSGWWTR
ncbi:hypothetical protein ACP70R_004087 [Stipagrostis hirtigluma subsp. patula]